MEFWRGLLPGVPDEQIVLPRYFAGDFGFPTPPYHMNSADAWDTISRIHLYLMVNACVATFDARGGDKTWAARTRRIAMNRMRAALLGWWQTVRPRTLLNIQQQLYGRHGGWKDILDYPELHACLAVTNIRLNLPKYRGSLPHVKAAIMPLLHQALADYQRELDAAAVSNPDVVGTGEIKRGSRGIGRA